MLLIIAIFYALQGEFAFLLSVLKDASRMIP